MVRDKLYDTVTDCYTDDDVDEPGAIAAPSLLATPQGIKAVPGRVRVASHAAPRACARFEARDP